MESKQRIRGVLITRKGEFTYEYFPYYFEDSKSNTFCFNIWDGSDRKDMKYSFILKILDNETDLKVVDMYACDYKGKGISIPIILKAKGLFGKRIISSANSRVSGYKEDWPGERNTAIAIAKVWEPMVKQGLAEYHAERDCYYVL